MEQLSELFKALSEPLRLRIVHRLLSNGKSAYYGEELATALGVPAYRLSRHLKVLTSSGLVTERKEGRWVYYSLANINGNLLGALRHLLNEAKFSPRASNGGPPMRTSRRTRGTRRRRSASVESKPVNWNLGPAIPGML